MPETIKKDNYTILNWNISMQENFSKIIMRIQIDGSYYSLPPFVNIGEKVKLIEQKFSQEDSIINFVKLFSSKEIK